MINILHMIHKYRGDYPLLNQQVNLDPARFRTVVCYLSGEDDGRNSLPAAGIKTLYLGFNPKRLRLHNPALLFRIRSIIDEENIQVVNCQQHRSTPLGVLAAMLAKNNPSVVSTLHGQGFARTFTRKLLNWFLYKRTFRIIGISHGVSRDILDNNWGLSANKVVTVQNGLIYGPFLHGTDKALCRSTVVPHKTKAFWFGTVGRLSEVKNHCTLIAAFADLSREMPEALLVIAGTGENEAELRQQVAAAGLNERVFFLGYRSDIPQILNGLDVFVLPSLREGFGLAMLEAMASRLPVIASRVGGIPEIFGDEDFGIMIDPNNPAELRDAMKTLANLPQAQREAMGDRARRRALEHFGAERMIAGYEQVYQEAYVDWQRRNRKVAR